MTCTITSELVEAYPLCPRKAFLYLTEESNPGPHEYVRMIDEQAAANRRVHRTTYEKAGEIPLDGTVDINTGPKVVADAELAVDGLHTRCDCLVKVSEKSRLGGFSYEPVKVIGTYRALRSDSLGLAYQGLVLKQA